MPIKHLKLLLFYCFDVGFVVADCSAKQSECFLIKTAGSHQYLQIVHSIRDGKKVRQQVLGTLGRFDELKASGRLEALIRSGLRHCENFAVIDAHTAGETQPVALRRIGPDLVFGRLWQESGLPEAFQATLKTRRYEFDVERAIYLTVFTSVVRQRQ